MCLLKAFSIYKMFSKVNFEVIAVTINPGFLNFDTDIPRKFCETIGIEFFEVKKDIKEIVFDVKNEKNPCSLCSTLRRGMLYDTAEKNGKEIYGTGQGNTHRNTNLRITVSQWAGLIARKKKDVREGL